MSVSATQSGLDLEMVNARQKTTWESGDFGQVAKYNMPAAEDFLGAWFKHGAVAHVRRERVRGGLLASLGFAAERGTGPKLVVPDLPPNRGSVLVTFGQACYLVDGSMLHGEPPRLEENSETRVEHPAWGVRCSRRDGRWHAEWRSLRKLDSFECRFGRFGATHPEFQSFYDRVVGGAFGKVISLESDGNALQTPVTHAKRVPQLIEDIGLSEEIARQLPKDSPTPKPPWFSTALSGLGSML